MGAPKKYKTARALQKAVDAYFDGITREKPLTEMVPTGALDKYGHPVCEPKKVLNRLGNPVMVEEFLLPPSVGDLARFLGIHRSTWYDYCDPDKHPEFSDTTTQALGRIHAYLERESLTREGKNLKGVIFNLENNFGYKERLEVQGGVEAFLRKLQDEGEGGQRF